MNIIYLSECSFNVSLRSLKYISTILSKLEESGALKHYRALANKDVVWSAKRKMRSKSPLIEVKKKKT